MRVEAIICRHNCKGWTRQLNLETAVDGLFAKVGKIGANGRMVHEIYLAEAKKPSESKGE